MEYFALFIIGLFGSIGHCAGMCGGFVSAYSMKLPQTGNLGAAVKPHLLFNSGRLLTYMLLGILFGAAGQTAAIALGFADLQASIRLFAGAAMIIIALQATGLLRQLRTINP
ncbi:MAG: sulfite exporter TauE/SafE family protein, partial [Calditrichota bacterium]